MAELCRKCFIDIWKPCQEDIDNIVISRDETVCEGCLTWGKYVDYIKPKGMTDEQSREFAEKRREELRELFRSQVGGRYEDQRLFFED